jgi:hypothetical protein
MMTTTLRCQVVCNGQMTALASATISASVTASAMPIAFQRVAWSRQSKIHEHNNALTMFVQNDILNPSCSRGEQLMEIVKTEAKAHKAHIPAIPSHMCIWRFMLEANTRRQR